MSNNKRKNILIAYGSRYGSSFEISKEISRILVQEGFIVEIIDLIEDRKNLSIDNFDGIIVGSGIRIGKWTKKTIQFLRNNNDDFLKNNLLLGVFASSLLASDPSLYEWSKQKFVISVLDEIGVDAGLIDVFGGIFDLSKSSQKNWYEKKLVKRVLRSQKYEHTILPLFKEGIKNDFRDWNQIRAFASKFADMLKYRIGPNTVCSVPERKE
ncbi:MAG: flavodoxin domain-containing protein [Candidatus Kariarchaeaceae archaeon]|jgi:menaquinone-dependent protoporphyrinogen oxidase